MRKNSIFLLGTAAGICLTLLVTGPQGAQAEASRKIRKTTVLELLDSIDALDCCWRRRESAHIRRTCRRVR